MVKYNLIILMILFNIFSKISSETTARYGFEEKLEDVTESVVKLKENIEFLMEALNKTQTEFDKLKEEKLQNTFLSVNNNDIQMNLDIPKVKCPGNRLATSCKEVVECRSHIYSIMIPDYSEQPVSVLCDLDTNNGGWTIVQRRINGAVNFQRNMTEYKNGFGDISGEFFIGLDKLHHMTKNGNTKLYILMEDFEGTQRYALYETFQIGSEQTNYNLTVNGYSGDAGNSLSYHNGQTFSLCDRNDNTDCGLNNDYVWWLKELDVPFFSAPNYSNLNGPYLMGQHSSEIGSGLYWESFRGPFYSLRMVQMMIH